MSVPHGHWKTTTFVGALRLTGMTAPMVLDGPINGLAFQAYVDQVLVPELEAPMQLSIRSIETAGPPEARAQGHRARLVIPPVDIGEHSPFLLMAEDWFAPPAGFPTHPHRGIETVTFVLAGELVACRSHRRSGPSWRRRRPVHDRGRRRHA